MMAAFKIFISSKGTPARFEKKVSQRYMVFKVNDFYYRPTTTQPLEC
jgi:hypothetical protein